jgi:hypothetical protein
MLPEVSIGKESTCGLLVLANSILSLYYSLLDWATQCVGGANGTTRSPYITRIWSLQHIFIWNK